MASNRVVHAPNVVLSVVALERDDGHTGRR
jgi:hypothetical protein